MQKFYRSIQGITFGFYTFIIVILLTWGLENTYAQAAGPHTKKKGDFVTQDEKEFEKIKKLRVKTRTKFTGAYLVIDKIPTDLKIDTKESFNKKGLITQMLNYNAYGKVEASYNFYYDSKENPIKATSTASKGRSNLQLSKYDSRGNEIERRLIESGRRKSETKSVFKYNKEGDLIVTENYTNGKLTDVQTISYKNGKRDTTIIKDPAGNAGFYIMPEFDSTGKPIREIRKNTEASLVFTYKYDTKGNLIEMIDNESKRNYTFDDNNNVTEYKMYLLDGRRQIRLKYNYNSRGLQSDITRFDNTEKPIVYTKFEYEYYK